MNETAVEVNFSHLPFFITAPGESDVLFGAVAVALVAIVVGFGALYFTIQAIPDRFAKGTSKVQMQLVGLLGLISLFTMNNIYWVAAILLAAVRIPDFMTPLSEIARSMRSLADREPASTDINAGPSQDDAEIIHEVSEADTTPIDRPDENEVSDDD